MTRTRFRLILDEPASGTWNMAVDEALLEAAGDGDAATLRLYRWSEPTLSLGYFQTLDSRDQHEASRECAVVRRQSGGGAILHDGELTYSLALPPGHPLGRDATGLYYAVHNLFIEMLVARLAADRLPRFQLALNDTDSPLSPSVEPFLCFQRRARGDLLLKSCAGAATGAGEPTYKILGSAQRRHRGAILQHGSFLISRSPAAPELAGWTDLTGVEWPLDTLVTELVRQFCGLFDAQLRPEALATAIRNEAQSIAREKYSSRSWTARR